MNTVKRLVLVLGVIFFSLTQSHVIAWPVMNGIAIFTVGNNQEYSTIVSDGSGGAIITWTDDRDGGEDIYAQQIYSYGFISPATSIPKQIWELLKD